MAEPRTYVLLGAVRASLAQIRRSAGYQTNAGASVTLEPGQVKDDAPEFLAVFLEGVSPSADPAARALKLRTCTIAISAKVPVELENAERRLHEILEDVELAMSDQQRRYPEGTDFPRFAGVARIAPADGLKWIGAVIRYTANIRQ